MFRSSVIVAFFTLISRISGLARELFIASLFGANDTADGVNIAFKLPNLFRRIFGEGSLSSAFIPIFNEKLLESDAKARKFSGEIFTILLISLVVIVGLMQIFMPSLMFIIAPGFKEDKLELTILLCRITMPYLIFISIASLFGSILNSIKRFAAFAFIPVILSLSVIFVTLILNNQGVTYPISISISVLVAGLLQVIFMSYYIMKTKMTFKVSLNLACKDVRRFLVNMWRTTIGSGATQLHLFFSQSIASFIPGAVSILSYADRIYQFPLSIIGITFSTILLPELSKIYKKNDLAQALNVQDKAIKIGLALSIPASIGIIILSHPIIHIIYERGAFSPEDTIKTAKAISIFSFGLPAFVLSKILTPIFYASGDTKTPLRITINSLVINSILNLIFMIPFGYLGIAFGSLIAAWYNVWLLYRSANKLGKLSILPGMKAFYAKLFISCFFMLLVLMLFTNYYSIYFYSESLLVKTLTLGGSIISAMLMFLIVSVYSGLIKMIR